MRYFLVKDKKEGAGGGQAFSFLMGMISSCPSPSEMLEQILCWIALVQSENLKEDYQFGVDLTHCAALCDKVKLLSRATRYFPFFSLH